MYAFCILCIQLCILNKNMKCFHSQNKHYLTCVISGIKFGEYYSGHVSLPLSAEGIDIVFTSQVAVRDGCGGRERHYPPPTR